MKKFFTLILIFLCIYSYSQKLDSLNNLKLETVQLNLDKYNNQYSTGSWYTVTGIFLGANGYFIKAVEDRDIHKKTIVGPVVMVIGAGMCITGYIIQLCAHKYITLAESGLIIKLK